MDLLIFTSDPKCRGTYQLQTRAPDLDFLEVAVYDIDGEVECFWQTLEF